MKTSYFAKSGTDPNAVCVCGEKPYFYKGRIYPKLGPKLWFFQQYKRDGDVAFYTEQYKKEVLDVLDPETVFEELGEDAILVC